MVKELFVYLNDKKVGILKENNGSLSFEYTDCNAEAISLVLPNNGSVYKNNTCQKFFSNLLPEGNLREQIVKYYGIKEQIFPLLQKIGGECSGAISFYEDKIKDCENNELKKIEFDEFIEIMNNLKQIPLGASLNNRLSLAGVQEKFGLYIPYENIDQDCFCLKNFEFYRTNKTIFSNFIVKQNIESIDNMVYNEFFCMLLAKELNFLVPNVFILENEGKQYLFVERFDRKIDTKMQRIQQEDFNQLLLNFPEKKYEEDGGCSIKQCVDILNKYSNTDDSKERFLKMIIFNFFIGNCDAHGKNFSLLHNVLLKGKKSNKFFGNFDINDCKGICSLSPVYDLLSTEIYDSFDKKLAMKIGGEYNIKNITLAHFLRMVKDLDINEKYFLNLLNNMKNIIVEKAILLSDKLMKNNIKSDVFNEIIELIKIKVEKLNG